MPRGTPKLKLSNAPLRRLLAGFGLMNVAKWGFVADSIAAGAYRPAPSRLNADAYQLARGARTRAGAAALRW